MKTLRFVVPLLALAACSPPVPPVDVCAPNPCLGDRSVCTAVNGAPVCSCRAGFQDVAGACVQPGPCDANPCTQANRGVCVASGSTAECRCDSGFVENGSGACVAAQTCASSPCTTPGKSVCTELNGAVSCACDPGLRDDGMGGCVSDSPCANNPCTQPNRGVCVVSGMTAVCQCDSGFIDDGTGTCVRPATCTPNPCTQANQTVCSVQSGVVTCSCDSGYRLDAVGQCVPVQVCNPNPCTQPNRGVCTESSGVAVCGCNAGYRDQGGTCVLENACAPNPCTQPNRGVCSTVNGAAVCGCNVGFHEVSGACVADDVCDPNPCTMANQNVCTTGADAGAQCACNAGYQEGPSGCELIPTPTCAGQHTTGDMYEPNECPMLATPIISGVPQQHTFEPAGDIDWVTFTADAGAVLRAEETGPLAARLSLYAADGTTAVVTNSTNLITRKLQQAGVYYLRVAGPSTATTGASTIAVTLSTDDFADSRDDNPATLTPVAAPGASVRGVFDFAGDSDCVAVPLQAGRIYTFAETTAVDVYLSVVTATGPYIPSTDSESLRFRASTSQTVFLCTRAYTSTNLLPWSLTVTDVGVDDHADSRDDNPVTLTPVAAPGASLSGTFNFSSDTDCAAVPVLAGRIYSFAETTSADVYLTVYTATGTYISTTDSESLRFETDAAETLFLCTRAYNSSHLVPWTLTVTDLGVDDFVDSRNDNPTTLTPVAMPGASVSGTFQYPSDNECFAVPVQANRIYTFAETTSADVYFTVYTATGTYISTTDSEFLRFETDTTETLFLCTRAYNSSHLVPWTLTVTDVGVDDHGDSRATATTVLMPGSTLSGTIDYGSDIDCVVVPVQANHGYMFDEITSTDVNLAVYSATATIVATTTSDSVTFKATATESYFFCVRHYATTAPVSWTLRVTDNGLDDHSDTRAGATPLTVAAAPVAGLGQYSIDYDYFSFTTAAPVALRVVTTGVTAGIRVETSTGMALATGTGPDTVTFSVPAAGTYYVRLSPWFGAYTIAIEN